MLRLISVTTLTLLCCLSTLHTQTDDIFNKEIVKVEIRFDNSAWHDTLAARKLRDDKESLPATITIDGVEYRDVDVRYKGNSSFHGTLKAGSNKLPLHLKTKKGSEFNGGYRELRLANNFRDPSGIRELLGYRIAGDYVFTPKIAPASVYINGTYLGVYTVTEGIEKHMIEEDFCNDDGVLIQCEPDFTNASRELPGCPKGGYANLAYLGDDPGCYAMRYDISDNEELQALMNLASKLHNHGNPETYLDVHATLWMHAINNVLVNLDSYLGLFCHNYFLYRDTRGIYHPLIWDLNLAFGGFSPLDEGVTPDPVTLSPIVHDRYLHGHRPLIDVLMRDEDYRRLYFSMIQTIVDEWLVSGKYREEAYRLHNLIRPLIEKEQMGLYTLADFDNSLEQTVKRGNNRSVPGVIQLMDARTQYLSNHTLLSKKEPEASTPIVNNPGDSATLELSTGVNVKTVAVYYRTGPCDGWTKAAMKRTTPGNWHCAAPGVVNYYFVISGESSTVLYPKSAPMTFYSIN